MTTINASDQEVQARYDERAYRVARLEDIRRRRDSLLERYPDNPQTRASLTEFYNQLESDEQPAPRRRFRVDPELAWTTFIVLVLLVLAVIR